MDRLAEEMVVLSIKPDWNVILNEVLTAGSADAGGLTTQAVANTEMCTVANMSGAPPCEDPWLVLCARQAGHVRVAFHVDKSEVGLCGGELGGEAYEVLVGGER